MSHTSKKTTSLEQVSSLNPPKPHHQIKRCESESSLPGQSLKSSPQKPENSLGSLDSFQISLDSSGFEAKTSEDFPAAFDLLKDLKFASFDPSSKIVMTDCLNLESTGSKSEKPKNFDSKIEEKKGKVFKPVLATRRVNIEKKLRNLKDGRNFIDKKPQKVLDDARNKNLKENLISLAKFASRNALPGQEGQKESEGKTLGIGGTGGLGGLGGTGGKFDGKIKLLPPEVVFDHDLLEERWKARGKIIESHELYHKSSEEKGSFDGGSDRKYVVMSQASSRNSVGSENFLEDSLMSNHCKKVTPREPSFGMGGGEFTSVEENSKDSQVVADIKEYEKTIQTESKVSNVQELLSIITDKEFINSLKIIGKFANFLERNLQRE